MPETKGLEVGIDGGKLVKGRKRSIIVDTMGYVICVFVHAANIYDGKAGKILLDKVFKKYHLKKVFADNTYRG
jgi:putative transposase